MSATHLIGPAVRAVLALLLVVPLTLAGAAAAAASPVDGMAFLRLAHLSPDTPPVDVTVVGVADPAQRLEVPGVAYGAVSEYVVLPPGSYTVSMRAAGAPASSPPVITTTFTAGPGEAVTVAGLGNHAELALRVLRDDLTSPPAGLTKVRVINAAPATPTLDVQLAGGPTVASAVPYAGASEYRNMPSGDWKLVVGGPGSPGTELDVVFAVNAVYSVFLVSRDGGLAAEVRPDGIGPLIAPSGSIPAGYGGAADSTPGLPILAVGTLAVALGLLGISRRRAERSG